MNEKEQQICDILANPESIKYAFQPIFDVTNNTVYGHEALMRPSPFSPMDIVEYCISEDRLNDIETITAIYSVAEFLNKGLEGKIFINSFPEASMSVEDSLKLRNFSHGRMAGRAVFEMLEYTKLDEYSWHRKQEEFAKSNLNALIAIDDYGTDDLMDSARIRMFHPNIIKIDISLVSNVHADKIKQDKINRILDYTGNNGIIALAEGVETKEEYDYLRTLPIQLMQGYYLGRPKIY